MKNLKPKHLRILKTITDERQKKQYQASVMLGLMASIELDSRQQKKEVKTFNPSDLIQLVKEQKSYRKINIKTVIYKYKAIKALFLRRGKVLKRYDFNCVRDVCIMYKYEVKRSEDNDSLGSKVKAYKEILNKQYQPNTINRPSQFKGTHLEDKNFIGIELEFFCEEGQEFIKKKAEKLKIKNFNIGGDGSINPDEDYQIGHEIRVLLVNEPEYLKTELKKLCTLLSDIDAQVNNSCGFHVHIDARKMIPEDRTKAARRLSNALPVLNQLVPKSRRSNSYCKLGVSKRNGCRYFAVNMTALRKYQTIEVRLHSGTTDFLKIYNWIELLNLIIKTKNGTKLETLDSMIEKLKMKDFLASFYYGRFKKFNKISGTSEESDLNERSIDTLDNLSLDSAIPF